jgi:hypothetical protein
MSFKSGLFLCSLASEYSSTCGEYLEDREYELLTYFSVLQYSCSLHESK